MDNTQADITADLTDASLRRTAADAYRYNMGTDCEATANLALRAVAALAREGWQPIPKDEGEVTAAKGEAQQPSQQLHELAEQLRELSEILTRMGFVTLTPQAWPSRLQRAAELLERSTLDAS